MNVCVAGSNPLRLDKRGVTLTENTSIFMDMDKQEEKTYPPQKDRILQGAAHGLDIVPVEPVSSSDNGPSLALPTSVRLEAFVEETQRREEPVIEKIEEEIKGTVTTPYTAPKEEGTETSYIGKIHPLGEKDIETTSIVSDNTVMECEEHRASKRKKSHSAERHSSEESENEILKRAKVTRRRRILDNGNTPFLQKARSRSNPDLSQRPSEEEPKIVRMRKGYISKQKRLEIKAEEEKRKKEEKAKAEVIIAKIGIKSEENMTASDLAAMALEYLDHIEIIRSKCGTMQGALSGELKTRNVSLDNMVRALQAKAEEKGDPHFLRAKIEELLKKNREEEEKKKRD